MASIQPMQQQIIARNNIRIFGHGKRVILFAHGFGCDQQMWRFVAPAFADEYRVVLFDYVGCGQADLNAYDPLRYNSLEGYARDLREICTALNFEDVVVVGHSVSGMIAALAAQAEPERFRQLVLICPSPCYLNYPPEYFGGFERADLEEMFSLMEKNFIGWAKGLAPLVMGNQDRPELATELSESFCSTDPITARGFARATFFSDYRRHIAHVSVPSVILQTQDDIIAPIHVGEYLHQQMPISQFHLMQATGHCPHVSHPDETIALLRTYLAV